MLSLYPPIKPYNQFELSVDSVHKLYVEECGEPDGIPILFVHGGPGVGCSKDSRRFFDPEKYRIILFDQRGAGRSTPHASLVNNSTDDLISDIEAIRAHCDVKQWILFGGSWGSTLSLLYAQAYPECVKGLILRGIFLCREQDFFWFYQGGASLVFPDYWDQFVAFLPQHERQNVVEAYYHRLTGDDELAAMNAAKHWAEWEARCATLDPNAELLNHFTHPHTAKSLARIEAHYFYHRAFIEEGQILRDMYKIEKIPGIIVHGRYDIICPLDNAFALYNAWPSAQLNIVREAGHAASEPPIADALVHATQEMIKYYD